MDNILSLDNWLPHDAKLELSKAAKSARLKNNWKRGTLSEKTGIPVSTIKRFETVGEVSLDNFLKIAFVLGDLDTLKNIFDTDSQPFTSLDEMLNTKPELKRKRGSL